MTDPEYVFKQTNKERASLTSSARKRKVGSKSKKCTLGSDHMTKKQLEAKNGPVRIFAMNIPCDFNTFNAQQDDIKKDYLEGLISWYGFRKNDFMELFHISRSYVNAILNKYHVTPKTSRKTVEEEQLTSHFMRILSSDEESEDLESQESDEDDDGVNKDDSSTVCYEGSNDSDVQDNSVDISSIIMKLHEFSKTDDYIKMTFDKHDYPDVIKALESIFSRFSDDNYIEINIGLKQK